MCAFFLFLKISFSPCLPLTSSAFDRHSDGDVAKVSCVPIETNLVTGSGPKRRPATESSRGQETEEEMQRGRHTTAEGTHGRYLLVLLVEAVGLAALGVLTVQ